VAKAIGVVAVSHFASSLCHRKLAERASAVSDPGGRPTIIVHNQPLATYVQAMLAGDWTAVGDMLTRSAQALAQAGADFCIMPDNLAHHAAHFAAEASPIPWLNMIDIVAERVAQDQRRVVGIVGTKMVMNGSIYQSMLGLRGVSLLPPEPDDQEAVNDIIFAELIHGAVKRDSKERFEQVLTRLAGKGCEGVIYASSELPLLLAPARCPLPAYDPVELLVERAMGFALAR